MRRAQGLFVSGALQLSVTGSNYWAVRDLNSSVNVASSFSQFLTVLAPSFRHRCKGGFVISGVAQALIISVERCAVAVLVHPVDQVGELGLGQLEFLDLH